MPTFWKCKEGVVEIMTAELSNLNMLLVSIHKNVSSSRSENYTPYTKNAVEMIRKQLEMPKLQDIVFRPNVSSSQLEKKRKDNF